ncbi:hypothetical protein H6F98_01160 [Microcoleus sp. FACHB-SPT15]|uniref:hypothetical protein n=1 Tax=Microcoleus sp. FACHB-SPT15 TaxID=2692830 RepID=UPI0017810605|nr:hypothetical protein [Microcoleus sp. FACHB-SPT15]MBD1804084.1 hypothetical protein [Microcoleus sp. FACHB-SPT15]
MQRSPAEHHSQLESGYRSLLPVAALSHHSPQSRSPLLEPVVQNKQDCPEDSGHWELRGCDHLNPIAKFNR